MSLNNKTNLFNQIKNSLLDKEQKLLSPNASKNIDAIRKIKNKYFETEYRLPYALDVDRILHSLSYTRYIDKTQVFSLIKNDHLTHRVLHVQLVSRIARTIGRFLNLNDDLIEAIALGHDIGHTPFGHFGEECLSELCKQNNIGNYCHAVQSVQFLDNVEKKGKGLNLCLNTLDGILCHDGESTDKIIAPDFDISFEKLNKKIKQRKLDKNIKLRPSTCEAAVVRISDSIGYLGRDIEDAIRLNLIKRSDLPKACCKRLGDTNGQIVYNLVTSVIENSMEKDFIAIGDDKFDALYELKKFNYEFIYLNPKIKNHLKNVPKLFEFLFEKFFKDLYNKDKKSSIYTNFLNGMDNKYIENFKDAEKVRDFISGMTDNYFLNQCPENLRPKNIIL